MTLRVLVACEFSGTVRDSFSRLGHDAWSCDLLPTETPGNHIRGDVLAVLDRGWDLMIAGPPAMHPPGRQRCEALFPQRADGSQQAAVAFFMALVNATIPRIAVENPVCIMSSVYRKPDQIIQPWMFGHGETKATCLWLKGLPPLTPTNIVDGRVARVHRMPPGPHRWAERSRTYRGIADAMAQQWGGSECNQ